MNKQYIRTLLDESIKGVMVVFDVNNDKSPDLDSFDDFTPTQRRNALAGSKHGSKRYLYLTRLDLVPGDYCVVEARDIFQVVKVVEVLDEPPIKENDTVEFKWVVSKIDIVAYCNLLESETQALGQISSASRGHHRAMVRQALLASCPALGNLNPVTPPTDATL